MNQRIESNEKKISDSLDGWTIAVDQTQLTKGFPSPRLAINRLRTLKGKIGIPDLKIEILPTRFSRTPSNDNQELVVGVHGPLEGNWQGAMRQILGGVPKSMKDRLISTGVLIGIGTQTGPFSLLYRGNEIAREMGVYYNLHPNVLATIGDAKVQALVNTNLKVLIENGWYDPNLALTYDPYAISDFMKKFGIGATLDTAHALQAALTSGQKTDKYLRQMWETLNPEVVHFSDRGEHGDHYVPGEGQHGGVLRELAQSMKSKPGLTVVLEVDSRFNNPIQKSIDFLSHTS